MKIKNYQLIRCAYISISISMGFHISNFAGEIYWKKAVWKIEK